ncbi:nucleoside deaminase [Candidatus Woesearchaeota archaeon]|nr:nucleoside deaminase [Candidatus Woesearchaeota archaeon]
MQAKKEFMQKAIELAKESAKNGDYALGAVIVKEDEIIATGTTNLKHENDPTVHAEIVSIRNACKKLNSKYLDGCILYTTHEPCPMCASAAIWAKMKGIVFGAFLEDAKQRQGKNFSWRQIDISCKDILKKGTPKIELVEGFLRDECLKLFDFSQ